MYKVRANVVVESDDSILFKKNISRKYDGNDTTITDKVVTEIYKVISKEFFDRYNKKKYQPTVAVKIFYISGVLNSDT